MDATYSTADNLHVLLRLLAARGLKTQHLPELNLPANALFNRRAKIPLLTLLNLVHWADQQLGDESLSLDFGMSLAITATAEYDQDFPLTAWADGLHELPMPLQAFQLSLRACDENNMMLELTWRQLPEELRSTASNIAMSWLHQRWLPVIAARHNQLTIFLPALPRTENLAAWIPAQLQYPTAKTAVRFPRSWLAEEYTLRRMPSVNSERSSAQSQLITLKATNLLRATLSNTPALEVLASQLGLSERTCKRRLQDCATHYQKLIGELRLIQASYWLQTRRFNVTAVAEELGYSSVANFSKAFKKWCGYSPSQVRHGVPAMCQQENSQRMFAAQA